MKNKQDKKDETTTDSFDKKNLVVGYYRFIEWRKIGYFFSAMLSIICIALCVVKGFNWGLDFTGGTVVETKFSYAADLVKLRQQLKSAQIDGAVVQSFGGSADVVIRIPGSTDSQNSEHLINTLEQIDNKIKIESVEFVGPNVGEELTMSAIYATIATIIVLLVYVGFRFEWRLGFGAILALVHDVIITLGFFSLFQVEINLTFIAAILSVIGYSLNDTIVVFDRVRENFRKLRKANSGEVINVSISQTLARTLVTSGTTLIVVIGLLLFGGSSLYNFSLALLIGILFGTYSSIFIASALSYDLKLSREHMLEPKVEKEIEDYQEYLK